MLNLQNINTAKTRLSSYNPLTFNNVQNSFRFFTNKITINSFRHISGLEVEFDHPVTVITGGNKIGKSSLLLLIACSHYKFNKYDSTKPETEWRRHTWRDVFTFTSYESATRNYSYELTWRVGNRQKHGEGKRLATSKAWTGLGKYSSDPNRINAQIHEREVRLIELDRMLPARSFSNSLIRKIQNFQEVRLQEDIEKAFSYILDIPYQVEISKIGSHVNKVAYLINYLNEPYSSYNASSGEESLINILVDIFEAENDSLILIDEIEAGFHPSIQRKLADVIQYVSYHHKKQFILTTHSPSFLSALPQKSRKFIDKDINGNFETINSIPVNAAFSRMDSQAYPLVQLYCEDEEADYIIKNILIELNRTRKNFDRLINIIKSGPINQVKNDYERHKHNFDQMRIKLGYCCVFDGDYVQDPSYSHYHQNPSEHSFFLYPYVAPEKFLIQFYLQQFPNPLLSTAFNFTDHHSLFQEMVNLGLAVDVAQARQNCWNAFSITPEYTTLKTDLTQFLIDTVEHFSVLGD
ncbi:hypothetical protein GCM10027443_22710 [Pontibacter brevis]